MSKESIYEERELAWRTAKSLEEISAKLDRVILLLELAQKGALESHVKEVLGRSRVRRQIFDLCDGKRTVRQIAHAAGKSIQHVSLEISEMEKSGIIKANRVGRERYYVRTIGL